METSCLRLLGRSKRQLEGLQSGISHFVMHALRLILEVCRYVTLLESLELNMMHGCHRVMVPIRPRNVRCVCVGLRGTWRKLLQLHSLHLMTFVKGPWVIYSTKRRDKVLWPLIHVREALKPSRGLHWVLMHPLHWSRLLKMPSDRISFIRFENTLDFRARIHQNLWTTVSLLQGRGSHVVEEIS